MNALTLWELPREFEHLASLFTSKISAALKFRVRDVGPPHMKSCAT